MEPCDIRVLAREPGYLRLRLPLPYRHADIGRRLEAELAPIAGVRYVSWLTAEGKLAIRYDPSRLDERALAQRVWDSLAGLPAPPASEENSPPIGLAERLGDFKARFIRFAPSRLRPLLDQATTEKALLNFANDVLMFYLIRVHWRLITERWLIAPGRHLDAWLAVFYLLFLLMRFRKS